MYVLGGAKVKSVTCDAYSEMAKDMKAYKYHGMWAEETADVENGTNDVEDFITGHIRTDKASISFNGAWAQNIHKHELFIDFINEEAFLMPFKWLDMMEHIFNNKSVNYVIDTTSVISTYLIPLKDLEHFYLFLRKLLLKGFVTKIIYKNEFIIIHYKNIFIKNSLCLDNRWILLVVYKLFNELNVKGEKHLYSLFKCDSKEEVLDFFYVYCEKYVCFSCDLNLQLPEYIKVYNILIYDSLKVIDNEIIKFTFNKNTFKNKLSKIFY